MNFKTHVIGGLYAGVVMNELIVNQFPSTPLTPPLAFLSTVFIAGSVIGSTLPDIDHKGSFIGRRIKIISVPLSKVATHRGITHTPILLITLISILLFMSSRLLTGNPQIIFGCMTIGLGIGIASHIILDALTKGGVPLLYPISKHKFSFLPIRTGSPGESLVAIIMFLLLFLHIALKFVF